jgi:hypothetical protein
VKRSRKVPKGLGREEEKDVESRQKRAAEPDGTAAAGQE